MRIAAFVQDDGACTSIRLKQPLQKIQSLGLAGVSLIGAGDAIEAHDKCEKADVVVFGRAFSENVLGIVRKVQGWGKKVVFDLDDNFFDVSPMSPHYKQLGIMPVNLEHPDGRKQEMWVDGRAGFTVANNRKIRRDFISVLRAADCVTVTNEPLLKEYLRFNDNVKITPNAIDFRMWEMPPIRRVDDEIRILYTGAANHMEDFLFVKTELEYVQKTYPNVRIVFVGTDWRQAQSRLDYSRVEVHPWMDIIAYPYAMKTLCCHIGIAPISKTKFNDCRSSIKWMEYSALKMATIATNWGPYARDIRHGETGLLCTEDDEWQPGLCRLIEDEEYRKALASNAYKEVKENHNLDYIADTWLEVFQSTMEEK